MGAFETEYRLFVNYGQGWEHETTESTLADIRQRESEYRANVPQYPVKWSKHRVLTEAAREAARETLQRCGVAIGADFHALPSAAVEALVSAADEWRYRKPRNANGSRGRSFHDMLPRRAASEA